MRHDTEKRTRSASVFDSVQLETDIYRYARVIAINCRLRTHWPPVRVSRMCVCVCVLFSTSNGSKWSDKRDGVVAVIGTCLIQRTISEEKHFA